MVKCASCGFLCFKAWEDGVFKEADREFRRGDLRTYHSPNEPVCFAMAFDLQEELAQTKDSGEAFDVRFKGIINRDRDCPNFTEWHQGFSPKEHREMMDRERMLQWQAEREEADRKHRRTELRWVIGGVAAVVIAAILGATATVAGAFIERSGQPTIIVNQPPIQVIMPTTQPSTPTPMPTTLPTPASQ